MDLISFVKPAVAGVPLVFVIIGFVYWFKQFKHPDGKPLFSGNTLLLVSMGWGLLLGGGYMLSATRPPVGDWWIGYVYWFGVFIYGVAMGIVASGLYSAVKALIEKQFAAVFEALGLRAQDEH